MDWNGENWGDAVPKEKKKKKRENERATAAKLSSSC
jgi:hypothetical protein